MEQIVAMISSVAGPFTDYVIAAIILIISFIVAKMASGIITLIENKLTKKSGTNADDAILEAIKGPVKVGVFIFGVVLALEYLTVLDAYAAEISMFLPNPR